VEINFYNTLIFRNLLIKTLFISSFFLLLNTQAKSQRFNSIVFDKLPQDYQLYPRDHNNEANVNITGIIEAQDYSYISIQVFRDDVLVKYVRAAIKYNSKGIGSFSAEAKIKAELAQYSFKVFSCQSKDSSLVVNRQNIVSGDVFIVDGQSNSTGFFLESATDPFCRTFGKITEPLNIGPYNPADTLWALSNQHPYFTGVGSMGFEIQKQLSQQYGIPNCLINGGFHWSSSVNHAQRTENNPADLTNGYGRMLYRIQKAGLAQAAKTFIYRQGESEAYHEGSNWDVHFKQMRSNLKLDLPGLEKIYVFQIDIIYFPSQAGAELRDYQRRLPLIYPDVQSIASVGTKGFDGLHYTPEGYKQNGMEISRLIAKDYYQLKDTLNINSPSIKKVFYASEEKKKLILVFDEGQQLVYPEQYRPTDNLTLDMKDFFYPDGYSGAVISGKAEGNRVMLELSSPQNASILNYLPQYMPENGAYYPYSGPYLSNKKGMRAFTFNNFSIATALRTPALTASMQSFSSVVLSWNEVPNATGFNLERKLSNEEEYRLIRTFKSATRSFEDKVSTYPGKIQYRLKATTDVSESGDYARAEVEVPVVLGLEEAADKNFYAYPNPVAGNQKITIHLKKPVRGSLLMLNSAGQTIFKGNADYESEVTLPVTGLSAGFYFIQLKTENHSWSEKLVISE